MEGKLFFIIVTIALPISFLLYAIVKKALRPLLLGMAAFVISQMLIRIPLLRFVAEHSDTYRLLSVTKPIFIFILLALTAALAEELARWVAMRTLLQKRSMQNGLLFGLGHGGVEAILIVGIPVLLTSIQFASTSNLLLSGVERLCAMTIHVCLSLIVLIGVRRLQFRYVSFAIFIHTFINFSGAYLASTQSLIVVELVLALLTTLLLVGTIQLCRRNF